MGYAGYAPGTHKVSPLHWPALSPLAARSRRGAVCWRARRLGLALACTCCNALRQPPKPGLTHILGRVSNVATFVPMSPLRPLSGVLLQQARRAVGCGRV